MGPKTSGEGMWLKAFHCGETADGQNVVSWNEGDENFKKVVAPFVKFAQNVDCEYELSHLFRVLR